MKRASVVGPLILIGIGVLFLARNLYPDLPLMEFLARYWPFLLIGWGVLRLIEIAFWAMNGRVLPTRGMSGGEWVVVVFLILIGSSMWAGHEHGWLRGNRIRVGGLEMFGEAFDYPVNGQKTGVGKAPTIVLESFRGNARINGADGDEVKVTGRKTIRALQRGDADQANTNTPFELVMNGSQVIIRTNQDRAPDSSRVSADLEITVPKGSSVNAVGRYGDFDINDLTGAVEIVSDNAGVRLQNIGGNVRIDTRRSDVIRATGVKGSVELKGRGTDLELQQVDGPVTVAANYVGLVQLRQLSKPVRFESQNTEFTAEKVNGQLRITLSDLNGNDITGPIRLTSRSKDVQLSNFTQSVEISLDRGDVELRPGSAPIGRYDVRTRSGDIEFAIPEKAKLDLAASTERGEITNDFGVALKEESSGRGATLKGNVGDGPRVVLSTNRGGITVRKSDGPERAAEPRDIEPKVPKIPKPPIAPPALKPVEQ